MVIIQQFSVKQRFGGRLHPKEPNAKPAAKECDEEPINGEDKKGLQSRGARLPLTKKDPIMISTTTRL
jgi:hypothetical protein